MKKIKNSFIFAPVGCLKIAYNHLEVVYKSENQSLGRGENEVGFIVAGLNTVMHKIDDNIRENRLSRQLEEIAKNDDPGKSLVERISNAVDGLGLGNATKVAILKLAQGLSSASDFPAEYFKSFSKLSTALGYASAIVSYNEYMNNPNTSNLIGVVINFSTATAGPYATFTLAALNATGVMSEAYNYLGNLIDTSMGYSVGRSLYNHLPNEMQQLKVTR